MGGGFRDGSHMTEIIDIHEILPTMQATQVPG